MTSIDTKHRKVSEAATEWNVSPATVRSWIGKRKIGYVRLGRSVRIPASEIRRMNESGYVPPKGERR